DGIVVGDLEEGVGAGEPVGPPGPETADDVGLPFGKLLDLALPLVLERRRADDEDPLDAVLLGHDLGGGDGLGSLAQAHLVADEAATGPGGEQGALALVIVERDLEQVLERGAADAAGECVVDLTPALVRVAQLGEVGEDVVADAQVRVDLSRGGYEIVKLRRQLRPKQTIRAEELVGDLGERGRTLVPGPEAYVPLRPVLQVDLAGGRPVAVLERPGRLGLPHEAREGELDVLAGAKRVGGEVGAGARVVARAGAANGDAVGVAAGRVDDLELGQGRVVAAVFNPEFLLPPQLPPQLALPPL